MKHSSPHDANFLAHAIRLAARGLGHTWPNPSVGCVLVKDNQVIATARTANGGRPHAEAQALAAAGDAARGATAYVSLEPCAHHGKTGPCAEALIAAGIIRVVIAATDPDPRVSGKGIALLEAAGIEVILQKSPVVAHDRGFFRRIQHGIPHVALKLATSLDGKIADATGASQWITSASARTHAHGIRAQYDAILTGIGTVLADDPELTVRLPGLDCRHQPRIVADRRLRLPLTSKLVKSAETQPVWVITTATAVELAASHATDLREAGVVIHVVEEWGVESREWRVRKQRNAASSPHSPLPTPHSLAPASILETLGRAGLTRLLVEAGGTLATAFLASGLVETLHWYRAPLLLGNAGAAAIAALETGLADAARFHSTESLALGPDRYECYEMM